MYDTLPYEIVRHIFQYVDDIELRMEHNIILPLPSYQITRLSNLYRHPLMIMENGLLIRNLPNMMDSYERIQNNIDDDCIQIGIDIMDDFVYYIYRIYIFKQSDSPLHQPLYGSCVKLDVFCWHQIEFDYIMY